jgi:hypothetical protein
MAHKNASSETWTYCVRRTVKGKKLYRHGLHSKTSPNSPGDYTPLFILSD